MSAPSRLSYGKAALPSDRNSCVLWNFTPPVGQSAKDRMVEEFHFASEFSGIFNQSRCGGTALSRGSTCASIEHIASEKGGW